jgi:hypothetical protein
MVTVRTVSRNKKRDPNNKQDYLVKRRVPVYCRRTQHNAKPLCGLKVSLRVMHTLSCKQVQIYPPLFFAFFSFSPRLKLFMPFRQKKG